MAASTTRLRQLARRRRARAERQDDPEVTRLEVWPPRARHGARRAAADSSVTATWTDGTRRGRDRHRAVRRPQRFASPTVTPDGLVTAKEPRRNARHDPLRRPGDGRAGDAAVREAGDVPRVRRRTTSSTRSSIAKWKDLGLTPSPLCSRRGVPAPALPRRHRHAADAGRGSAPSSPTSRPNKRAKAIDTGARPAGVRRLLGAQVGRPAAHQPHRPAREGHVELPQLGARPGSRQQAGRRVRPRHRHRRGQHVHRRARELLP